MGEFLVQKYDAISFRKLIPANEIGSYEWDVPAEATIEQIEMFFAQGQQFALQLRPVILQSGSLIPTPIIIPANNTDVWIAGDNVTYSRKVSRPLTPGDKIVIYYRNTDNVNALHLVVDVDIDYYAGKARVE